MGRYRDATLVMQHLDQVVALEHSRREIESSHHFVVHSEQQQMAEVGVGLNPLEDGDLKSLRKFGVQRADVGIAREQPMLGEANRAQAASRILRELEILLRGDIRVGRKQGVDVKVGDHQADAMARRRSYRAPGY